MTNVLRPVCPLQTTTNVRSLRFFYLFPEGSSSNRTSEQISITLFLVVCSERCCHVERPVLQTEHQQHQGTYNASTFTVIQTSLCPLFISSWPQRDALHLMRPSGFDVDKNYSCNHLGFGTAPLRTHRKCLSLTLIGSVLRQTLFE